jgi:hypothetical protein
MNAQHNEMTMDEMDQVNGGFLMLLFYAIASKPANAPAVGGKTYRKAGDETIGKIKESMGAGVVADENGKPCTDPFRT